MGNNELIKGEYYHIYEGDDWAIFKHGHFLHDDLDRIYSYESILSRWGSGKRNDINFAIGLNWYITGRGLRPATYNETLWLNYCKNQKLIEFGCFLKENMNYEIY